MYVDLWLATHGVAVELKYRTRKLERKKRGEWFLLRDQGAHPPSRYSFLKDVQRLEECVRTAKEVRAGVAVFLTNDAAYWNKPTRRNVVDAEFRLHEGEGRRVSGEMDWSELASPGTKMGREEPIRLRGEYPVQWRDYESVGKGRYAQFRYLTIRVDRSK